MNTQINTVESLLAEARRHGFNIHGGFHPCILIPHIEARLERHRAEKPSCSETSQAYTEWNEVRERLDEFLAFLKTLPDRLPYEKSLAKSPTSPRANSELAELKAQVEKILSENAENAEVPEHQPDPTVPHPSTTRRSPVPDPSTNASSAFPNASADATGPDTISASSADFTQPSYDESEDYLPIVKAAKGRAAYLAELLRESVAGKSPIDDLPPERQEALYQLIQHTPLTVAVKMIAAPEPTGWNFKTSDSSLRRFNERYRKKAEAAQNAKALAEACETIQQNGGDEQACMDATRRLLKIKLYKNAAEPDGSFEKIELIMRLLDRQRRTDILERRVSVAEQRAHDEPSSRPRRTRDAPRRPRGISSSHGISRFYLHFRNFSMSDRVIHHQMFAFIGTSCSIVAVNITRGRDV